MKGKRKWSVDPLSVLVDGKGVGVDGGGGGGERGWPGGGGGVEREGWSDTSAMGSTLTSNRHVNVG